MGFASSHLVAPQVARERLLGLRVLGALAAVCLLAPGCRSCAGGERRPDAALPSSRDLPETACRPIEIPEAGGADGGAGHSASFVIKTLRFGQIDDGLDLDCVDTPAGCRDDFCREGPEDGSRGQDNRLGVLAHRISTMAGSDLQAEMTQATDSGEHPLVLRVIGATSFRDGHARAVELDFGLDADGDTTDLFSGRGTVRPDPHGPAPQPSRFAPVAIVDGVVTAGPTQDWMPLFWTRGQIATVPVETAYLRFRIATPPRGDQLSEGRITEGLLAGAIGPTALSDAVLDMDARTARVLQRVGPLVRALVKRQSDLDLVPGGATEQVCHHERDCTTGRTCRGGQCIEPADQYDALSFGVSFEAVSVLEPPAP